MSGSTTISVMIYEKHLYCANVGDSRAIIAKRVSATEWKAIAVSRDQNPSLEAER